MVACRPSAMPPELNYRKVDAQSRIMITCASRHELWDSSVMTIIRSEANVMLLE
jgi:hypothetical protein